MKMDSRIGRKSNRARAAPSVLIDSSQDEGELFGEIKKMNSQTGRKSQSARPRDHEIQLREHISGVALTGEAKKMQSESAERARVPICAAARPRNPTACA